MNIPASRRWVAAFVLLWPGAAFAYFGAGIVLLPVFLLAGLGLFMLACWVLIPALMKAWAIPARGSRLVGVALAVGLIGLSALVIVAMGAASTAAPLRASPLVWRSLALATALAAVLIVARHALRTPNATLPRLLRALAVSWALLPPLAWLWDGWTAQYQPVQRTAFDVSLSSLRLLRTDELGPALSAALPAADSCVLRVRPPGAKPDEVFAVASYRRRTVGQAPAETPEAWQGESVMLVGLPGETVGAATYMGLSRVSFRVWQWLSLELRPPKYWRAAWARELARLGRQSSYRSPAASGPQGAPIESFADELLRIDQEHQVSAGDAPEPYRLNVVTDEEIACDTSVPHCRRFRAHLVADGAPVELEERCSDRNAPSSFSAFGRGYQRWD